ncbi:MAG: T9SS type A sorting domain-containing protein, partial [Bacteroidia bacterium]|nr:T9SS type A sorting domain-containing protein [Bacteroidia bacterium]
ENENNNETILQFYNVSGQLVKTQISTDKTVNFSYADVCPGLYFASIVQNQNRKTIKILVH